MNRICSAAAASLALALLAGCSGGGDVIPTTPDAPAAEQGAPSAGAEVLDALRAEVARATDDEMFTKRDRDDSVEEDEVIDVVLEDAGARASDDAVFISGSTVTIREEGAYRISGELDDGSIIVDAPDDAKVHLVLDGVRVRSANSAALLVLEADKVFVTLAAGSENLLVNGGAFQPTGEVGVDGAVFSRRDISFNGSGALTVDSPAGHGMVCNRDLVFCGGSYAVTAASHGLKARKSVRVGEGSELAVSAGKDGIHVKDDDDPTTGFAYISGGSLALTADDDGISTESNLLVTGGSVAVQATTDALHTNASIAVTGGELELAAGGLAFHADVALLVAGGDIDTSACAGETDAPIVERS